MFFLKALKTLSVLALWVVQLNNCLSAYAERRQPIVKHNLRYSYVSEVSATETSLDIVNPLSSLQQPIAVFFHGGEWQGDDKSGRVAMALRNIFTSHGIVFASVNYRKRPHAAFPNYIRDAASAVAYLYAKAKPLRISPDSFFLVGEGSGAHIAAILGIDTHYLKDRNVPSSTVNGLILLNGSHFDLALHATAPGRSVAQEKAFRSVFTSDARLWRTASATHSILKRSDIPPVFVAYSKAKQETRLQNERLVKLLQRYNSQVETTADAGSSEKELVRWLGRSSVARSLIAFVRRHRAPPVDPYREYHRELRDRKTQK